jgi:hypothetical protein
MIGGKKWLSAMMSMPDALPTEITFNRTTLVSSLFDFPSSLLPQANHSFHIPITLSVNYTPHGIDQHPAITSQEVLLSIGLVP